MQRPSSATEALLNPKCGRRWAPRVAPPHRLNNLTWSLRAGRSRRQVPQLGARRAWQLSSSMPPRRGLRATPAAASPPEGSQRGSHSGPGSPGPPLGRADPCLEGAGRPAPPGGPPLNSSVVLWWGRRTLCGERGTQGCSAVETCPPAASAAPCRLSRRRPARPKGPVGAHG